MRYVVSTYFWAVFLVTCPLAFLGATLVFLATFTWDPRRRWVHAFVCRWTFAYLRLNPWWKVRVLHRERLPRGRAVLVANHKSAADIVVAMGLFSPFKFVSKASLFRLPIVGWAMRLLGYVELERGRPRSTRKMIDDCRKWLALDEPVLIFPEGTYGPAHELLPFRRGAFRLAIEAGVPVVPIALRGTRSLIVEDGPWFFPRCDIEVEVLPALAPEELGSSDAALAARVRELLRSRLS